MEITTDNISQQIPYYLTQHQKNGLVAALKDFKSDYKKPNYYVDGHTDILQGDGWYGLQIINFDSGEKASILGIVLSNSCDISSENERDLPIKITFAPLIPLSSYTALLNQQGISTDKIRNKILDIKAQRITNIFYLPECRDTLEEHIALLTDVHTMPATAFYNATQKRKSFTLSMFGFYLFIFKLSIHFCRFHENVNR